MVKVDEFIRPTVVSLAVAATSPKSQRLTVRGTVSEIGALVSTPTYTRRRLVLVDNNLDGQVGVTMWGNPAREIAASVNDTVVVTAVEVNAARELNATKLSCVEVEEAVTIEGVVVGTSMVGDGYPVDVVYESGDVFGMPEGVCNALMDADLPTTVSYRLVDGVIAEMRILQDLGIDEYSKCPNFENEMEALITNHGKEYVLTIHDTKEFGDQPPTS